MRLFTERNILILLTIFALSFLILAIIGGLNNYSAVPLWGMWDGYFHFYIQHASGGLASWITHHDEHRILLARLLFWLDFQALNGQVYFLVICNYLFAMVAFLIIYTALRATLKPDQDRFIKYFLGLIIFCLCFAWGQYDNFSSAFQGQIFFAQVIPLGAFLLLYKTDTEKNRAGLFFTLACLAGIAAWSSMANGALALSLMVIMAVILRMNAWKIIILSILAILAIGFYFYVDSSTQGLRYETLDLLKYVLLYLGNPVYLMLGHSEISGQIAGIFLIMTAIGFLLHALKSPGTSSLQLALVMFLFYITGAAIATGLSGANFEIEQALSSRYTTPVFMAWAVLLVLYAPMIARKTSEQFYWILPLLLIPLLLLPQQLKALQLKTEAIFDRKVSALALELGIKDDVQLKNVYPSADRVLSIASIAAKRNWSIFDDPLIRDVAQLMGQKTQWQSPVACVGRIDSIEKITTDPHYVRITGWLFQPYNRKVPAMIRILNHERVVVGYALTGGLRNDVKLAIDKKAELSGFTGYLLESATGQSLILQGLQPACELVT
jgi:hypothetical protein